MRREPLGPYQCSQKFGFYYAILLILRLLKFFSCKKWFFWTKAEQAGMLGTKTL
jgi:hypothetical protein